MNLSSPLEIYKDISAGSAQINPFSDYFQESEDNMKNLGPIFGGRGITRDIHVQMPYSCDGRTSTQDNGCDSKLPREASSMEAEDIPGPYSTETYDYSKGVFFDYSNQNYQKVEQFMQSCDPLKGDTNKCLENMFECGDDEWDVCKKYIDYCPGEEGSNVICKYNLNKELIKRYVAPQILKVRTQPFCKSGETSDDCLKRFGCTQTDAECNLQICEDDPNYVCKSNGQRFYNPSPVPVPVVEQDVVMFQKRGVGEFFSQ